MGLLKPKYIIAIVTAGFFDFLQFALGVAIAAAFFHPATALAILGCVVSENYISTGTCWVGALIGGIAGTASTFIPILGPALIAITDAIGAGLAAVVDFCFSMIGMAIIIPMLIFEGIVVPSNFFKSWRRSPFLLGKIIPGLDMLPFFTTMVVLSVLETEALKKAGPRLVGIGAAAARAESIPARGILAANRGARQAYAQTAAALEQGVQRARGRTARINDIRPSSRRELANRRAATGDTTRIFRDARRDTGRAIQEGATKVESNGDTLRQGNERSLNLGYPSSYQAA